jgi:hypothetical protein
MSVLYGGYTSHTLIVIGGVQFEYQPEYKTNGDIITYRINGTSWKLICNAENLNNTSCTNLEVYNGYCQHHNDVFFNTKETITKNLLDLKWVNNLLIFTSYTKKYIDIMIINVNGFLYVHLLIKFLLFQMITHHVV